jgi:DNA-directed RNA polymerase specialized sigma24 family protein
MMKVEIEEEKMEGDFMESPSFEHLSDDQQVMESMLVNAIASLDEGQRLCVEQFYLGEKSYKEVSEATGLDLKQVKSYIQNGMRNLKIYFKSKGSPS